MSIADDPISNRCSNLEINEDRFGIWFSMSIDTFLMIPVLFYYMKNLTVLQIRDDCINELSYPIVFYLKITFFTATVRT